MNPRGAAVIALVGLAMVAGAESPDEYRSDAVQKLSERSDLIIDATILEDLSGGMGGGPIPRADRWTIRSLRCCPKVWVNRVLKGDARSGSVLLIEVAIPVASYGEPQPVPREIPILSTGTEAPLLAKGERAIIFLEDRPKREPASSQTKNGEEVRYRTFDFWLGKMPFSQPLAEQIAQWQNPP